MTRKQENEKMRNSFIKELMDFIESQGNEAIRIKNNEVAFPIVYENGDEAFMKIAVSIPSGSRDGDIFDAYSLAEEYVINEKKKKAKTEQTQKRKKREEGMTLFFLLPKNLSWDVIRPKLSVDILTP